ncbi:unnamed protein product [Urochloa humidicola]
MLTEIGIRIPPSDPARLVRLALACKRWLRILTSGDFGRAYATRHGRPPLVGYFLSSPVSGQVGRFVPSVPPFPRLSPRIGTESWYTLDIRQGRVLLFSPAPALIVWLPVSGEYFRLPHPPRWYQYQAGAVICADDHECRDPHCCSIHKFRVVFVGCEDREVTFNNTTFFEGNETWASIYCSETNEWSQTYPLKDNRYTEHPLIEQSPPVLHADAIYFTLEVHELEGEDVQAALKFDLADKTLSVVLAPDDASPYSGLFFATSQGLTFAGIAEGDGEVAAEDDGEVAAEHHGDGEGNGQIVSIWTFNDADNTWSLTSDIHLKTTLPAGAITPTYSPATVGFVQGEATLCIDSGGRLFTVEVDTLRTRDIGPSGHSAAVMPFLHYFMPSKPKDEDNGSESRTDSQESEPKDEDNGSESRTDSQESDESLKAGKCPQHNQEHPLQQSGREGGSVAPVSQIMSGTLAGPASYPGLPSVSNAVASVAAISQSMNLASHAEVSDKLTRHVLSSGAPFSRMMSSSPVPQTASGSLITLAKNSGVSLITNAGTVAPVLQAMFGTMPGPSGNPGILSVENAGKLAIVPDAQTVLGCLTNPDKSNGSISLMTDAETEGYAVEFTQDGVNGGPEDEKNTTSKGGVIRHKREFEVGTPSGKKPKGEQSENFSVAEESSTQEKTLGGEDLE